MWPCADRVLTACMSWVPLLTCVFDRHQKRAELGRRLRQLHQDGAERQPWPRHLERRVQHPHPQHPGRPLRAVHGGGQRRNGIQLTADAAYSRIGADSAFHETIISGNALDGILIAAPFVTVLKYFVGVAIAHPGVTARTQAVQ